MSEAEVTSLPAAAEGIRAKKRCCLRRAAVVFALLLAALALFSGIWYVTAYRPYDAYAEALLARARAIWGLP